MEPLSPSPRENRFFPEKVEEKKPDLQVEREEAERTKEEYKERISALADRLVLPDTKQCKKTLPLILGDSFIQNTGLEGGIVDDYVDNWNSVLQAWNENNCIINPKLSEQEEKVFAQDLKNLQKSRELTLEKNSESLMSLMRTELQERGRFALSIVVVGSKNDPTGHTFPIVFTTTHNGCVVAHILNKGEGSENHPLIKVEGKPKRNFQYHPIHLGTAEDFFAHFLSDNPNDPQSGHPFFATLMEYAHTLSPDKFPYSSFEIYRHLEIYGTLGTDEREITEEDAVTGQRAGTCPMQVIRLVARHQLLHSSGDPEHSLHQRLHRYKRLPLAEKSHALLQAYALLRKDETAINLDLVENCVAAFQSALGKAETEILTPEEIGSCNALGELLQETIGNIRKKQNIPPQLDIDNQPLERTPLGTIEYKEHKVYLHEHTFPKIVAKTLPPHSIPPENFAQSLAEFIKTENSLDKAMDMHFSLFHLPLPGDDYWNQIPEKDIDSIMENLARFPEAFYENTQFLCGDRVARSGFIHWLLLDTLTAYAISLHLADRSPTLHMQNFRPPRLPLALDPLFHFHTQEDTERWESLVSSIQELENKKQKAETKVLGLWQPSPLQKPLKDLQEKFTRSLLPEQQHIHYFLQFDPEAGTDLKKLSNTINELQKGVYSRYESLFVKAFSCLEAHNKFDEDNLKKFTSLQHGSANETTYIPPSPLERASLLLLRTTYRTGEIESRPKSELNKPQERTENAIVMDPRGWSYDQDKSVYHAFAKILHYEELQIASLVEWCEENSNALEKPVNRHFIEILFLRDQKLVEKIRQEPHFTSRIRRMIDAHIERNVQDQSIDATLFWTRLGIHIETHIAKATELPIDEKRVAFFCNQLDRLREAVKSQVEKTTFSPLWDRDIFTHKAYVQTLSQPKTEEHVAQCISDFLQSQFSFFPKQTASPNYLPYEMRQHLHNQWYFHNQIEGVRRGIASFITSLGIEKGEKGEWNTDDFPIVSVRYGGDAYQVDLRSGIITKNGERVCRESIAWERFDDFEKSLVAKNAQELFPQGPGYYANAKGTFSVRWDDSYYGFGKSPVQISMEHIFAGKKEIYTYTNSTKVLSFSQELPLFQEAVFWKGPVAQDGSYSIMITDKEGNARAQALFTGETTLEKIIRVDTKGYPIKPEQTLVTMKMIKKETKPTETPSPETTLFRKEGSKGRAETLFTAESSLAVIRDLEEFIRAASTQKRKIITEGEKSSFVEFMQDIAKAENTVFWTEKNQIAAIVYPPATDPLLFRVQRTEEQTRIYCENIGGDYCLAGEQDCSLVNDQSGSFLLLSEKPGIPRIIGLPARPLTWIGKRYQEGNLHFLGSRDGWANAKQGYYFYEIDEKTQQLHSSSPEAMLHLIYTLVMQGDYEKAESYCKDFSTHRYFTPAEQDILQGIFSFAERHPQAIALRLRLGLTVLDAEQKAKVQDPSLKKEKDLFDKKDLAQDFDTYLHLSGRTEWNQIPIYFRLSKAERKRLCEECTLSENSSPAIQEEFQLLQENVPSFRDYMPSLSIDDEIERFIAEIPSEAALSSLFTPTNVKELSLASIPSPPIRRTPRTRKNLEQAINLYFQEIVINKKNPITLFNNKQQLNRFLCLFLQMNKEVYGNEEYTAKVWMIAFAWKKPLLFAEKIQPFFAESAKTLGEQWDKGRELEKALNEMGIFYPSKLETPPLPKIPQKQAQVIPHPEKEFVVERVRNRFRDVAPWHAEGTAIRPLGSFLDTYFAPPQEEEILPEENTDFALEEKIQRKRSPLAQTIGEEISQAYRESIVHKKHRIYSLMSAEKGKDLERMLTSYITTAKTDAERLRQEVEKVVNEGVLMEQVALRGGQRERLSIHDMIYNPDHPHIRSLPPATKQVVKEVIIQYMQLESSADQAEKAQIAITQGDHQLAGEILDWERRYDPAIDSELLLYEYFSGNQLRNEPDQVKILQQIFACVFGTVSGVEKQKELQKLFFEFQAGGGKTKVLSTIIALRAIHEGRQPVFFSLPDLHDVSRADLQNSLQRFFHVKIAEPIQLALTDRPSTEQLENMYHQVQQSARKGHCDVLTPEAWHALHLNYQEAYLEGTDSTRIQLLTDILNHYKTKGIFLIDEAHVNLDALLRANIAFGNPIPLPEGEQRLYIDVWKALMGIGKYPLLKGGKPLHEALGLSDPDLMGIRKNEQALKSKKYLQDVQESLVDFFANHPIAKTLSEDQRKEYQIFLQNPKDAAPEWMQKLYKGNPEEREQAQALALARGMIYDLAPQVLRMVHIMDYGVSSREDDPTESPWENKKEMVAKFETLDMTTPLTIQGHYQRGLLPHEMKRVVSDLVREFAERKKKGGYADDTQIPAYRKFAAWQKDVEEDQRISLATITPDWLNKPENIQWLMDNMGKSPDAIDQFLIDYALPSIRGFPKKLTSTAADMAGGCFAFISFSATLGRYEKYPYIANPEGQFLQQTPFLADVTQRSCLEHNRDVRILQPGTPKELFTQIYSKEKSFHDCEGWLNVGGWAKEYSSEEAAHQFLAFSREQELDYDGVVYFKTFPVPGNGKEEKVLCLLKKGAKPSEDQEIRLEGSNLAKELPKHRVEGKKVFKIYGPSETTGTDLVLSDTAKMILTGGENLTVSRLAQGIVRMRKFLRPDVHPENSQKIIWVFSPEQEEKIKKETQTAQEESLTPEAIWDWAIDNEGETQKNTILSAASQEIEYALRTPIKEKLDLQTNLPISTLREEFTKHKKAFEIESPRDPFLLFGTGKKTMPTEKYLQEYSDNLANEYGVDIKDLPRAKEVIDGVVQRTKARIDEVPTGRLDLNSQAVQKTRQKIQEKRLELSKELEKQRQKGTRRNLAPHREEPYAAKELSLLSDELFSDTPGEECLSANAIYDTALLADRLYILRNAFLTLSTETIPTLFKPYHYVLVAEEKGKRKFFCVSQIDAKEYQKQLLEGDVKEGRHVALFSPQGQLIQNGHGEASLSDADLDFILQGVDNNADEVFTQIEFLNGKIRDREHIQNLYRDRREECKALWDKIENGALEESLVEGAVFRDLAEEVDEEQTG